MQFKYYTRSTRIHQLIIVTCCVTKRWSSALIDQCVYYNTHKVSVLILIEEERKGGVQVVLFQRSLYVSSTYYYLHTLVRWWLLLNSGDLYSEESEFPHSHQWRVIIVQVVWAVWVCSRSFEIESKSSIVVGGCSKSREVVTNLSKFGRSTTSGGLVLFPESLSNTRHTLPSTHLLWIVGSAAHCVIIN